MDTIASLLNPPHLEAHGLLRPNHVGGRAAWAVLLRDRALRAVTEDAAVPAGVTITPAHRAIALAPYLSGRNIIVGLSAYWVHCGGPEPTHRDIALPGDGYRYGVDSVLVGGQRVLNLERTAVIMACTLPYGQALAALYRLYDAGANLAAARLLLDVPSRTLGRPQARKVFVAVRNTPRHSSRSDEGA
ncbi:MAG: hypothetical protein FWD83_08650 [Promicromonosporaceae bacterium]|nr:hypothetical protein [Promicromonosporaceae bacterium]